MAFHHSLDGSIEFKTPVTPSVAISLLRPLAEYFKWTDSQLLSPTEPCDQTIILYQKDGQVLGIELHTEGEVIDDFPTVVEKFASSLAGLAKPDYLDLRNHTNGTANNPSELIWYGSPEEVANVERERHVRLSLQHLQYSGAKPNQIASVGQFIRAGASKIEPVTTQQMGQLFWQELTTTFGCLHDVTRQFGAGTLASLFYLYAAINNNRFVEHRFGESQLLEVVSQMPSFSIWQGYIQTVV
jgi:hypothetical protein